MALARTIGARIRVALVALAALVAGALPLIARPVAAQPGIPRTSVAPPGNDVFLVPLITKRGLVRAGVPANVTHRDGYDNQPSFAPRSNAIYFTSNRGDGQTDIYRYDIGMRRTSVVRRTTLESEYSAMTTRDSAALTVIRVEADSTQRLWQIPLAGGEPTVLFPGIKPVGYFAQADDSTWALFVLGNPATKAPVTLQLAVQGHGNGEVVAENIGRSLHRIPGSSRISYVQKGNGGWWLMALDPRTRQVDTLVRTIEGSEDVAWLDSTTLVGGKGSQLFMWRRGDREWHVLADFSFARISGITRLAVSPNGAWLAMVAEQKPRAAR